MTPKTEKKNTDTKVFVFCIWKNSLFFFLLTLSVRGIYFSPSSTNIFQKLICKSSVVRRPVSCSVIILYYICVFTNTLSIGYCKLSATAENMEMLE